MEPKLVKFEVKKLPKLCVIGKEIRAKMTEMMGPNNPIPAFWEKCMSEDVFTTLGKALSESIYDSAYVGFMKMLNEDEVVNVCGMLMKPDAKAPEGFVKYDIESFTAGIGWVQGKEPDIYTAEHTLVEEALIKAGYTYDASKGFAIELYNCPRFTNPDENGNKTIDYYIPIVK
jgi:predicted transcriptional regulator YdeE